MNSLSKQFIDTLCPSGAFRFNSESATQVAKAYVKKNIGNYSDVTPAKSRDCLQKYFTLAGTM